MQKAGFWDDLARAQKVSADLKNIQNKLSTYYGIRDKVEEIELMLQLIEEEEDEGYISELKSLERETGDEIEKFRITTLLSGEYDRNNAILTIHAGAGGTEAQDWAEMLMRMYTRWAEKSQFKVQVLDILSDTEAGIKSVTLLIQGEYAYGYLKSEKGVHRLVRISPFDSSNRRHTSFASADIMPELDDDIEIDINPADLKIDTFRSSGAGGQHVNTTDSAVRITHVPTGVVVSCQNERSQHKNKATAMKMLMAKLVEIKETENKEKIEDIQGNYNQIAWGSQIRSYVFHPYNLVKDHRTNAEKGNIQAVMDGDLDLFMNEYLKMKSINNKQES
ncbi:peptide chain release factor 2 [Dethiosulfatibacter aminovorans DSM 17477]|uniref:Peptide chain release factor 2 n=2 Tax=Dethiosulfatibacter TaxID=448125 RepID=A0A1M6FTL4_9FIRM|nr:peptide chain release factor 2 [Dethiosulfatibacter aminovorans DSM 17477]